MIQTQPRSHPQPPPVSIPANLNNLYELVNSDPILADNFRTCTNAHQYWHAAHQLMLDGLRYRAKGELNVRRCCCTEAADVVREDREQREGRTGNGNYGDSYGKERKDSKTSSKQKNKHYNVSFVKHARFLSPSQRKQLITPKVTQIIPAKPSPLVIYGKPRIKMDNECGCPYHNNEEQCLRSIPYGEACEPKTSRSRPLYQVHVKENQGERKDERMRMQEGNQLSRYKSSPNLNPNINTVAAEKEKIQNLDKTRKTSKQKPKNTKKAIQQQANQPKTQENQPRPSRPAQQQQNIVYVNRIVEVQSRMPGKMRIVRSPNRAPEIEDSLTVYEDSYLSSRYQNTPAGKTAKKQVESKIKFLIERDKKKKEMEKHLRKQEQKIDLLEKLIKQDREKDKMQLKEKKTVKISTKDILSLSSDSSSSSMEMMDSQMIKKYRNQVAQDQSEEGSAYFGHEEYERDCSDCSKTLSENDF